MTGFIEQPLSDQGDYITRLKRRFDRISVAYALPIEMIIGQIGNEDFEKKFSPLNSEEALAMISIRVRDGLNSAEQFESLIDEINALKRKTVTVAIRYLYELLKNVPIRQLEENGMLANRRARFYSMHQCYVLTRMVSIDDAGIDTVDYMILLNNITSSLRLGD